MLKLIDKPPLITGEMEQYIKDTKIPLRLSCLTTTGWPLILSLWYVYRDGVLYCSTQETSKLVQFLKDDPRCAFEIASEQPPYRGIRGKGEVILDREKGKEILGILIDRYLDGKDSGLAKYLLSKSDNETAVIIKPLKLYTWDFSNRMEDAAFKS